MAKINVANFLKELAEKAGIDSNDTALIDVLSHAELNRIELPNEVTGAINRSLLSLSDAKNNHPAIKSHYFAEVMSNVDRALTDAYRELDLDQATIDELNAERSSTKRVALLATKMAGVTEAKVEAAGKKPSETVASLNTQINDLNNKLRVEKEQRVAEAAASKAEMSKFRTNLILNSKASGLRTIYDNLPSEVRLTTIDTLLAKELQDSNAQFVLGEDGNLALQKKDGSNFFDEANNRQLDVDGFINRTLAKHKVLKQSDAPPSGETQNGGLNGSQNNGHQPTVVQASQNGAKINMGGLISESLAGLDSAAPSML